MTNRRLSIPLTEADVRSLNIGDIVYLDGLIYTCRSLFQVRAVEQDILPPVDFTKLNVMVHMGPVMKKADDQWVPVSLAPTSSIRFEKLGGPVIKKLGIRAIAGKTTMGEKTMQAMAELGCVHLSLVGILGNIMAKQVKKVVNVYDLDELGSSEATWILDMENWGPLIVDIDAHGHNLFHDVNAGVERKFAEAYARYGIKDYQFTDTNAGA